MNKTLKTKIIFGIMFEVNLLFTAHREDIKMDQKSFELLANMYHEIKEQLSEISKKLDKKADKSDIVRLENELTPKIQALFDGYKQHTDILERIENEVMKQDEIIMRRVK